MANITIQPSRPTSAAAVLRAIDVTLDRVEEFIRSISECPGDLRHSIHEAKIRHLVACGCSGQAMI